MKSYDRTNDDPIWIDYRVPGEPAHDGLRETMGFGDTSEATPLMTEAAGLAFDQLIAHYRASRQTPPKP